MWFIIICFTRQSLGHFHLCQGTSQLFKFCRKKFLAENKHIILFILGSNLFQGEILKIHLPSDFTFFVIMHLKAAWAWHTTPSARLNKTEEQMAADLYLQAHSACLHIFSFVKINHLTFHYVSDWNSWFKSLSIIKVSITSWTHMHIVPGIPVWEVNFLVFLIIKNPTWRYKKDKHICKASVFTLKCSGTFIKQIGKSFKYQR